MVIWNINILCLFSYNKLYFNFQLYFSKPSDNVDGLAYAIFQHVLGIIDSASLFIGLIADRLISVWGGKSCSKRYDLSDDKQAKRNANKRSHRASIDDPKCEDRVFTFRGKPLAMVLYQQKRQCGAGAGPTRGKESKKPQAGNPASSARCQRKVLPLKIDGSRSCNWNLYDGDY